jgi:hypothetical protein
MGSASAAVKGAVVPGYEQALLSGALAQTGGKLAGSNPAGDDARRGAVKQRSAFS